MSKKNHKNLELTAQNDVVTNVEQTKVVETVTKGTETVTEGDEAPTEEAKKAPGRPKDPTSKRQQRIAELEAKRAAGVLRRGRPENPNSKRQLEIKRREALIAAGVEIKCGRKKDPNSKRQQEIAAREAAEKAKAVAAAVTEEVSDVTE